MHNLSIFNVGVCHVALQVHSCEPSCSKLLQNKIEVLSRSVLFSEGTEMVFFCLDPDGVRLELVEMI